MTISVAIATYNRAPMVREAYWQHSPNRGRLSKSSFPTMPRPTERPPRSRAWAIHA